MHLSVMEAGGEKERVLWGFQDGCSIPAASCPGSQQRCHPTHIQPPEIVSMWVPRENRRKPRFIMFKLSQLKAHPSLTHELGMTGADAVKYI